MTLFGQAAGRHADVDRGFRKKIGHALGPLDRGDAVAVNTVVQTESERLVRIADPVKVDVVQPHAVAAVLVDQRKRRAADRAPDAHRASEPLHETRLAGAEIAVQGQHGAGLQRLQQVLRDPVGFLRTARDDFLFRVHGTRSKVQVLKSPGKPVFPRFGKIGAGFSNPWTWPPTAKSRLRV